MLQPNPRLPHKCYQKTFKTTVRFANDTHFADYVYLLLIKPKKKIRLAIKNAVSFYKDCYNYLILYYKCVYLPY